MMHLEIPLLVRAKLRRSFGLSISRRIRSKVSVGSLEKGPMFFGILAASDFLNLRMMRLKSLATRILGSNLRRRVKVLKE